MDSLLLSNGTRLVGTIERMDASNVLIDTDFGGKASVARGKVVGMRTVKPVTVIFDGDEYLTGRITPGSGEDLRVNTERAGESRDFSLDDVKSVYRGSPEKIAREAEAVKLSGDINIGLSNTNGNTDTETYAGRGEIRARTPENRYTARLERTFERDEGDKTEDEAYALLKYDHFLSDKWFLFNSASFEFDEIQGINLRSTLAAGAGYQFFETDDRFLYAEAGPAYVNEDFEEEDNQYASARWAVDYEESLFDRVSAFHNQQGLFGLTDTSRLIVRTQQGFRFLLGNGFNATAQADIDYELNPPEGARKTDREYILTLGYGF